MAGLLELGDGHGHHDYGHYSSYYDDYSGHDGLYLGAYLGRVGHYGYGYGYSAPYYGYQGYYRSYYPPVYDSSYYEEPIYYAGGLYDDYPDSYTSYTTIYAGDTAGSYNEPPEAIPPSNVTVIVDPSYQNSAGSADSTVYGTRRETDSEAAPASAQRDDQASVPPAAALIEKGHKAFLTGDYAQAQGLYLRAVLTDGNDGYAKLFMGLASFAQGDYDLAALGFRQALVASQELAVRPIDLRQFYAEPASFVKQLHQLEKAAIQEPAHRDVQFLLAYLYYSTGQPEKALAVATALTDRYPGDAVASALREAVSQVTAAEREHAPR